MNFLLVIADKMCFLLLMTSLVFVGLTGYLDACIERDVTPFNVTQDGQTVHVTVGGLELLRHSLDSPVLFVGTVREDIDEFSGNFFFSEYIETRVGLSDFELQRNGSVYYLRLSFGSLWATLRLSPGVQHPLVVDVVDRGGSFNSVWLRVQATPDEHVYGGGEQFSLLDLRGRVFPIWTREQGVGRNKSSLVTFLADSMGRAGGDYYTTYFPQPTWLSSRNYYVHYGGSEFSVLDFTHQNFFEMFVTGTPRSWYFQVRSSMKELVMCLTEYFGRMRPLPSWLHEGAILGVQGGTSIMLSRLALAMDAGIPVRGLWIQDWSGSKITPFGTRVFWNWEWQQEHYPGLNETIQVLKQQKIRVLAYINPSLDSTGELFKTASAQNFLVQNSQRKPYIVAFGTFACGMVDFTNPEAYTWYKNDVIKKNIIGLGFGGWMADFGEYLPVDAVLYNGQSPRSMHNLWPRIWAQLNREAVNEMGEAGADIVFFSRSGFSGTSNATLLMWAGDQNVDWSLSDGPASTVPAALSMGLSGVGLTHFDVGSYTTYQLPGFRMVRTPERLLRSAEHAVFGPVFRTHEGNIPQLNAQFYSSDYILRRFKRLVDMFVLLGQYHLSVVNMTVTTGLPAQRPLFLSYPEDKHSYSITYEYMYGDDLLIAPVYLENVTTWPVYLPSDAQASWVFLWNSSHTSHGGETLVVPSPLGKPPVFYRNTSSYSPVFRQIEEMAPLPDNATYVDE